ncbi:MAG: ribosome biogenesis GTPase Der [Nitratireductor sp.]
MSFVVAIIGRPNVGKSTLFNRLVGRKLALVDDQPGVTRDRRLADANIGDLEFQVIDTAGLEQAQEDSLAGRMNQQTEMAIEEADVCLFLIDSRAGITPADEGYAKMLRKHAAKVVVVANKLEGKAGEPGYYDSFRLGLGDPVPFSAEHGIGNSDLYNALVEAVGEDKAYGNENEQDEDDPYANQDEYFDELEEGEEEIIPEYDATIPLKIAVVGRPNAGKSTLINGLIGQDRLLTGPEAGITRDSISVEWEYNGRQIKLHDTAGMRKKARINEKLEKMSVSDGLRAMQFAEVVIILIDATKPFEKQDVQIADLIIREGRAPVIALNKWDLIEDRQEELKEQILKAQESLSQVKKMKVVPISGLSGEGIPKLMDAVFEVHKQWNRRIPTSKLNNWLDDIQYHHPPPAVAGRRIRMKYATQIKTRPPTFMVNCTRPESIATSYERYMINSIRQTFDLWATPIRIMMKKTDNPYHTRGKRRVE